MDELTEEQQKYYDLELLLTSNIYDKYKNKIKEINEEQDNSKGKLLALLLLLIGKLADDDILQLTDKEIEENKNKINDTIKKIYDNEYQNELDIINKTLENVISDSYYSLGYLQSIGIYDYKFDEISKKEINELLNEKIEEKTYKDRIKNNKKSIYDIIKIELESFLLGTLTVNEIKKIIERDFKTNLFNSTRLLNDQISRLSNKSKELFRRKNNIDNVVYCSILCPTTCKICKDNHGKIYNIEDKNKPNVPIHINCYCFYISIVDKKWKNNNNNINYESFDKWINGYI